MNMKNADLAPDIDDDLAPRKLDWSKAVRGKYYNQFQEGTNLAIIDPEIHEHFPDSESVNRALRAVLTLRDTVAEPRDHPSQDEAA